MIGYDISWAAFNVIEVMSSAKFTHKVSCIFKIIKTNLSSNLES